MTEAFVLPDEQWEKNVIYNNLEECYRESEKKKKKIEVFYKSHCHSPKK